MHSETVRVWEDSNGVTTPLKPDNHSECSLQRGKKLEMVDLATISQRLIETAVLGPIRTY